MRGLPRGWGMSDARRMQNTECRIVNAEPESGASTQSHEGPARRRPASRSFYHNDTHDERNVPELTQGLTQGLGDALPSSSPCAPPGAG